MVLCVISGIAMPGSPTAYKFCDEDLSCMVLSESEVIQHTIQIMQPPSSIVVEPTVCVHRLEADDFLCKRD